ncbi:hypothetical protein TSUD_270990 [Trifolium subterraneum]|uniref:Uncharacterized protein n=1 Tax=Trifolium subterraneum TaxID=3900 RepID=A0A2Z6MH73_TRISU|nr:hypothetical protein TSUD_270990 [Trifolium subterraneum]
MHPLSSLFTFSNAATSHRVFLTIRRFSSHLRHNDDELENEDSDYIASDEEDDDDDSYIDDSEEDECVDLNIKQKSKKNTQAGESSQAPQPQGSQAPTVLSQGSQAP